MCETMRAWQSSVRWCLRADRCARYDCRVDRLAPAADETRRVYWLAHCAAARREPIGHSAKYKHNGVDYTAVATIICCCLHANNIGHKIVARHIVCGHLSKPLLQTSMIIYWFVFIVFDLCFKSYCIVCVQSRMLTVANLIRSSSTNECEYWRVFIITV